MATLPNDEQLYSKFESVIVNREDGGWALAVFEGSPDGDVYSWCPDCVAAKGDLVSFLQEYRGPIKVVQFKVGTKGEWEGWDGKLSPFKERFPHLSDIPTAILFHGKHDVARIIAPRKKRLELPRHEGGDLRGAGQGRILVPAQSFLAKVRGTRQGQGYR